ncbi:MAG: DNA polymerase/3'-5' exonuclease PolX [Deltaproteobacteria bacterium]|nr:DNA polymerase/3'-5' exonuclease PolX [Deltaproteobacteria bacterium]
MDKHQIANVLAEMAALLDLKGENPFKVRAYENAARVLDGLSQDLDHLIARKQLTDIKGIGANLATHITELHAHGTFDEYVQLRRSIPEGVVAMLAIPGLGAKKVGTLWKKLKITTIDELEKMCRAGKIAKLEGFGEKSQEKILKGIESVRRFSGRHLVSEAHVAAAALLDAVKKCKAVLRAEVGGSVRRYVETVGDIDILVATKNPEAVMDYFVTLPDVTQVVAKGATKSSVVLSSGINADLRAVTEREFPFTLHYFTGSKAHNVAMRSLAKQHDMKLNEYGLFKGKDEKRIPCKDEAAIFAVFGLDFIPPELREDMGEMEAAAKKSLPRLVEQGDLKGVLHAHTTYSDGRASLEEMAFAAKKRGFAYLGISDHSKSAAYAGGLSVEQIHQQHREIDQLNKKLTGIRLLKGIECDILADGSLDYSDDILETFDFVIASIHSKFTMTESEMTKRICAAISNPHVDILAHPTGRLLLTRDPYPVDMLKVIQCAAKQGVAIEINSHPQRLDLDWRWGQQMMALGVKTLISPDAHSTDGLDVVRFGIGIARKGWFEKEDVLNCFGVDNLLMHFQRHEK